MQAKEIDKAVSVSEKKTSNESVGCREKRLANQRQYQKEKTTNESVECRKRDCYQNKSIAKVFSPI